MLSPCLSRWVPAKSLLVVASGALLFASTVLLQGCGLFGSGSGDEGSSSSGGGKEHKEIDYAKVAESSMSSDHISAHEYAHNDTYCSEEVARNSQQFLNAVEQGAPKYFAAIKKEFTDDYVKYPFCLENRRFLVWRTQRALRGTDEGRQLAGGEFEVAVENRIQENFREYQGDYENYCQEWATKNAKWQTDNMEDVAKVLNINAEDIQEELEGFFNWHTWWTFFETMQNSGCMTKYVNMCAQKVKVAHRLVISRVAQRAGNPKMTWLFYPDNPHDVLGISPKDFKEDSPPPIEESSSLAERNVVERRTKLRHKESIMPIELRPTGHMLLRN